VSTLAVAAVQHLRLLRSEQNPRQDALYVRLAAQYGVPVSSIAEESGLPERAVRAILEGKR